MAKNQPLQSELSSIQSEMDSTSTPNQDKDNNDKDTTSTQASDEDCVQTPDSHGKRKESAGGSGSATKPSKVKRILPTRSPVWDHFRRTKENRDRCICNYCENYFSCLTKSGTSNLQNHLLICKQHQAWLNGKDGKQPIINDEGTMKTAKVTESVCREAANEMIVLGELPLSFIESAAWKHFCKKVNLFKPISRRTSTKDIIEMYVQRKATLKKWFLSNKQRVSCTTDIWVSQTTGASYMVVTVHYIDQTWRLKKLIIGFKHIMDHKGQTIATVLLECLADWGIEKVFCVTVDNATANSSALRKFHRSFALVSNQSLVLDGEFMHMRCTAHIINLIVRHGMAEIDANVTAIRNGVAYVRSHSNRLRSFELKVESGKLSRGSLPLDVKTRWNSTYLMLTTALKYKVAFEKMEIEDKLYNDYFLEVDNGVKRIGPPQFNDWRAVEKLCRFLVIFYNSTLVVSASTSVNAHKCYEEIVTIASNLLALGKSSDYELKSKATEMYKKFDKYWDGLKNLNKMLIVATVFDPTKKLELAKMCFEELYGKDSTESMELHDSVMSILRSLFTEYSARYVNVNGADDQEGQFQATQSSQSSQSQSSDGVELADDGLGYQRMDLRYKRKLNEIGVRERRDELERYLKESVDSPELMVGIEFDVLSWWKKNSGKYPVLSEIARDVLAMQVSSVASESAFSTSGRILEPHRSCLSHYMVEVLMCTEQWLHQDIRMESRVLTNAQVLADLEEVDRLERENEDASVPQQD